MGYDIDKITTIDTSTSYFLITIDKFYPKNTIICYCKAIRKVKTGNNFRHTLTIIIGSINTMPVRDINNRRGRRTPTSKHRSRNQEITRIDLMKTKVPLKIIPD